MPETTGAEKQSGRKHLIGTVFSNKMKKTLKEIVRKTALVPEIAADVDAAAGR